MSCSAIIQSGKRKGEVCGTKLNNGICRYHKSINICDKKIVTSDSDVIVHNINTTDQSSTDTIMCVSQVKTEIKTEIKTDVVQLLLDSNLPKVSDSVKITFKIKGDQDEKYMFDVFNIALKAIIRVESIASNNKSYKKFYWFCGENGLFEMESFVNQAHLNGFECHEVMWHSHCHFFMDIDLVLTDSERQTHLNRHIDGGEDEDDAKDCLLGEIVDVYDQALKQSLTNHKISNEVNCTIITRIRQKANSDWKYSIHVITDLWMPINHAKALADEIKPLIANVNTDLDRAKMIDALDTIPYGRNKSLSMVGGMKDGYPNVIYSQENNVGKYLTVFSEKNSNSIITDGYETKGVDIGSLVIDEDFVTEALKHVKDIPFWEDNAFDLDASVKKPNFIRVRRYQASYCANCKRTHDNDNTLLLSFNPEKGIAFWKCHHSTIKYKRFYIDPKKIKDESDTSEVPFVSPTQDGIPAIFDKHNPCTFDKNSRILSCRDEISWADAYEFVYNNIAYISSGGKGLFLTKTFDLNGNLDYHQVSISQMTKSLLTFKLPVGDRINSISIIGVIRKITGHITYGKVDFIPYSKPSDYNFNDRSVFNTFTGFTQSYETDFQINHDLIARYLDHIKMIWCNNNEVLYEATIKWFAHLLQNPSFKTQVCLVVLGREGTGKNLPIDIFRDYVMGRKYMAETCKMDKLTGRFNSLQENKLLIALNEAANVGQAESHDNQERLKDMITNQTVVIERKGIDSYTISDRCNYICFSNNDYVIKASTEMRRYVFFETSPAKIGDQNYFNDLIADFEQHDAGIHLYHYLMSIDISNFTPQRDFPTTKLKEQLKVDALEKSIQWLIASVNEELEYHHNVVEGFNSVGKMRDNFNMWLDSQGVKSSWTANRFGRSMAQVLGINKLIRLNKVQYRGYDLSRSELKTKLIDYTRRSDLFN